MRPFHFSTLTLVVSIVIMGCQKADELIKQPEVEPTREPSLLTGVTWRMTEWYHQGVHHPINPTDAQHTFFFDKSGLVIEEYVGGCCQYEGTWVPNADTTSLTMTFTHGTVTYKVDTLAYQHLKLSWLGREGRVIETYCWGRSP